MKIANTEISTELEITAPKNKQDTAVFKKLMEKGSKIEAQKLKENPSTFPFIDVDEEREAFEWARKDQSPVLEINEEKKPSKEPIDPSFCPPYLPVTPSYSSFIDSVQPTDKPISDQIYALMEKVGSEMIVMTSEGSTKTTLILNNDLFESTLLENAEITIEEFSSAPKIFNVTISAGPRGIEMVRSQMEEFLKLFQEKKFGFSINRIDTEISSSKPIFSRKEMNQDEEEQDQQGSNR